MAGSYDPHPYFEALREAAAAKKQRQFQTPASRKAKEAELKLVGVPPYLCFVSMRLCACVCLRLLAFVYVVCGVLLCIIILSVHVC